MKDDLYFLKFRYVPSERRYNVIKSKSGYLFVKLDIVTTFMLNNKS